MIRFLRNLFQLNTESEEAVLNLERIKREMEEELKRLEKLECKIKAIKKLNDRN